jgi:DNA-binding HxlR family transcriptional regulator
MGSASIRSVGDVGQRTKSSSVLRAIRVLGDRWSLLIIRDAFQGKHRFQEFLERTGTSRATLTNRLRSLVEHGIFKRVLYTSTPPRYEYRLTAMGRDLFGLSLVAWRWERHWAPRGAGIPLGLVHSECKHTMEPDLVCSRGGEAIVISDTYLLPGPAKRVKVPPPERYRRISALTAASHRGTHRELTHIADIVGDPWTPLVLATAFFGLRRFDDMQRELGIATNVLADRLELLVRERIFARSLYMRRPARYEYRLTDKGRDLFGYALMQNSWGDRWLAPGAAPYLIFHRNCARQLHPVVRCSYCKVDIVAGTVQAAGRKITSKPKAGAKG